jgi:hypothetical protein
VDFLVGTGPFSLVEGPDFYRPVLFLGFKQCVDDAYVGQAFEAVRLSVSFKMQAEK